MNRAIAHTPPPLSRNDQSLKRDAQWSAQRFNDETSGVNIERTRAQMRQLAWLLDESIPIPFLGVRIGVDGLIGLIPGVGDLISTGISSFIIRQAALLGVSKIVLLRMTFNTAVDFVVGAIPLIGDLVDFGWKANKRNVQLVVNHLDNPSATKRSSWLSIVGMSAGVIAVLFALLFAVGSVIAVLVR